VKITRVMCDSALLLLVLAASAQQPTGQPPKETRTRVVLLGTGTPVPDPGRSGPRRPLSWTMVPILSISARMRYLRTSGQRFPGLFV
jgi:hypothetical protein